MNTIFKILWFENELEWYRMEKIRISSILQDHYLVPEIIRKDGDDFLVSEITGNDYDIILMDYMLAEHVKGDTLISEIRENNILTDILFYSSDETNMLKALATGRPFVDGVYITKRDYEIFTEKAKGLIEKIIKRSENLVNLRGMVMDGSADFEVRIKEVLNITWNKFSDENREILKDAVQRTIERNKERNHDTERKVLSEDPFFIAAVNDTYLLNQSDRLYLLEKTIKILCQQYSLPEEPEFNSFKSNFEKEISHYRNALGHKKSADNIIEVTKGAYVPIDEELHQTMRRNLTRYNELIEKLEKFVCEKL